MFRYWIFIVGVLFPVVLLDAQEPSPQFYLLRSGSLLEGTATQNGKHYVVHTSFGSLNVPIQNIEFAGPTKKDVYQYKQRNVDPADSNALIQFAEWCLSNGLTQEGIAVYQRASQTTTNTTLAALIQKRLADLQRTETPTLPTQLPVPQVKSSASPSFSKAVFENYVRKVQPILVSRCASADCHGTHSNQQFKMGISQESMGSTSRRNMQSVLAYVNLDHPAESILLSALTTPHGGMKTALSVESESYIHVVRWVQQVAKEIPLERNKEKTPQAASEPVVPIKVSVLPEQFRYALPKEERPPVQEFRQSRVSDSFDPAVFNEKYHSTKPSGHR